MSVEASAKVVFVVLPMESALATSFSRHRHTSYEAAPTTDAHDTTIFSVVPSAFIPVGALKVRTPTATSENSLFSFAETARTQ